MSERGRSKAHKTIRLSAEKGEAAVFGQFESWTRLPEYDDEAAWSGRSIEGAWLAAFLTSNRSSIHRRGLTIIGARITGGLELQAVDLQGWLGLEACQFGDHPLNMAEARVRSVGLTRSQCGGLKAEGLQTVGDLRLNDRFTATGLVDLVAATIGGSLDCAGGIFKGDGGSALEFDRAEITGDALLNDRFRATGTVGLRGATIGGSLRCGGGSFAEPNGTALAGHQAHIGRTVFLDEGFRAEGRVNLMLTTIGGDLDCTGGTFTDAGRYALIVPSAQIGRSVFLNKDFVAEGAVALVGTSIGIDLDCTGGRFTNPGGAALWADRAQVGGAVNLCGEFAAKGEVRLTGATIGRHLDCTSGSFDNPDGEALSATATEITRELLLHKGFVAAGLVSLTRASAGALVDDKTSWPQRIDLDGFRYDRLDSPDRDWRQRREWLRRQSRPSAQGYVQLAAIYRASGDDHDARKILIERHNALLRPPAHWQNPAPHIDRMWRWLLRYTVGHGYEPWRVLGIVVPLLVGMSFWYNAATLHDIMVPTAASRAVSSECDESYTCIQPVVYALDTLLPLVDFGQRSRWTPDQSHHDTNPVLDGRWVAAGSWTTTALGWVFATLVAAGLTQTVRRE